MVFSTLGRRCVVPMPKGIGIQSTREARFMGGLAETGSRTGDGHEMANPSNSFSIVSLLGLVLAAILLGALLGARNDSSASLKKAVRLRTWKTKARCGF